MVPQGDFMFAETRADLLIQYGLLLLDICQRSFDFLLQRDFEVQLVQRVQRHDRMKQVSGVQTSATDLLGILEAEQDYLLIMDRAPLNRLRLSLLCLLRFHLSFWRYFLSANAALPGLFELLSWRRLWLLRRKSIVHLLWVAHFDD